MFHKVLVKPFLLQSSRPYAVGSIGRAYLRRLSERVGHLRSYRECARFVFLDPLPSRIVGFQGSAAGTACFVALLDGHSPAT
jgi:hypothetical protein